jgi:hypothetical protein
MKNAVFKRLFLTPVVVALLIAGCSRSGKKVSDGNGTAVLDEPNGIGRYLDARDLADLVAVERWPKQTGQGLKLITEHYEICTTFMEPLVLRQLPRFMELAYQGYTAQLPVPIKSARRSTVYLFADRGQWEQFTRDFAGEHAELFCAIKEGAYCHNGACVAYNIGRTRTFSALAHEGWHQFSGRHFKYRLPSWLDEGVAMLFEQFSHENGTFRFAPQDNDYRIGDLKQTITGRKMLPLRDLLAMNPGEVLAVDQSQAVRSLYSQWYALVRFLREGSHGARLAGYQKMLADGADGNWPIDSISKEIARDRNKPRTVLWNEIVGIALFKAYIEADLDQIQREYLAFCRQIAAPNHASD